MTGRTWLQILKAASDPGVAMTPAPYSRTLPGQFRGFQLLLKSMFWALVAAALLAVTPPGGRAAPPAAPAFCRARQEVAEGPGGEGGPGVQALALENREARSEVERGVGQPGGVPGPAGAEVGLQGPDL